MSEGTVKVVRHVAEKPEPVDYTKLFVDFCQEYRNVFIQKICDEVYIYRALGRGEYREILDDKRFSNLKKEEIICNQCLLYPDPEKYDWSNKEAGKPTELMKAILTDSYLDTVERRQSLHDYYRSEMYNLDNQISCIIAEAFPKIDIEEIESWDVEKTTKYLSRAEWIIHNLRGVPIVEAQGAYDEQSTQAVEDLPRPEAKKEVPKKDDSGKTIRGGERASKLTPEKIKEREEFLRKFPQFAAGTVDDIDGMANQETVDAISPALRVGD